MSTKIVNAFLSARSLIAAVSLLALSWTSLALAAPEGNATDQTANERSSISVHTVRGGRENPREKRETVEDYGALVTAGIRTKTSTRGGQMKPALGAAQSQSGNIDFWFYEADVVLFNDDDNDGYYHGIDLLFDVDTNFIAADVFAVMYLSFEGGPWNEYAETETFTIYGTSADDEYVLVSELMQGYPTGNYDILIELFDDFDGAFLTSFGPDESSELSYLPLEDFDRDAPIVTVPVVVVGHGHGGGGAMDSWLLSAMLILLIGGALLKIWKRRNDTLVRIDTPAPAWREYSDHQRNFKK